MQASTHLHIGLRTSSPLQIRQPNEARQSVLDRGRSSPDRTRAAERAAGIPGDPAKGDPAPQKSTSARLPKCKTGNLSMLHKIRARAGLCILQKVCWSISILGSPLS